MTHQRVIFLLGLLFVMLTLTPVGAQDDLPPAELVNAEAGGPVVIGGTMPYTYAFLTTGVTQPVIFLDDVTSFLDPTRTEPLPRAPESLVYGALTSDFETSPLRYSLSLPIEPRGLRTDLNRDDVDDDGVMVFAVTFRLNVHGTMFLDPRDYRYTFGPWLTYSSMRVSQGAADKYNIIGGKLIVYAPNDQQAFPAGFGADGVLFTDDDLLVRLPAGYTTVDLDTLPFTFDRSRAPDITIIEPDIFNTPDFSDLSYTAAFDALVAKMSNDYAFTDLKNIDWVALLAEFRPRFEAADAAGDPFAYQLALRDFTWRIPDGHVSVVTPELTPIFRAEVAGGLGLAIRELDDERVLVTFVGDGSPAAEAGIDIRAEVIALDGVPIRDAIRAVQPWSAPFSTAHNRRLQQERYLLRFPIDTEVTLTYRNPGSDADTTVTLTAVREQASFAFSSFNAARSGFEFPIEFELLDSGYGYLRINSFFNSFSMTVEMWEHIIDRLNAANIPGVIIDMRQNGGGESYLAEHMAAYFFDEPLVLGNTGFYAPDADAFVFHPRDESRLLPPPEDRRYRGEVVVLVGPACASACELFAYALTLNDRAEIVGQYPTAGLGGAITAVIMPDDLFLQYTFAPGVGPDGEINIEGIGVIPDIRVPVSEETLFSGGDPVLEAAVTHLDGVLAATE